MKLIINISDEIYKEIAEEWRITYSAGNELIHSFTNGIILPSNVTNKDILKIMFPSVPIYPSGSDDDCYRIGIYPGPDISKEWMNAIYKGVDCIKSNN